MGDSSCFSLPRAKPEERAERRGERTLIDRATAEQDGVKAPEQGAHALLKLLG